MNHDLLFSLSDSLSTCGREIRDLYTGLLLADQESYTM